MPEPIVDEVFAKANAIRVRWPYLHDDRFRWRMDRAHFDAIVAASDGPPPEDFSDLGPRFAEITRESREDWEERRRRHADSWGKDGTLLLGWPIVCDDDYPGIDPEVVLRDA